MVDVDTHSSTVPFILLEIIVPIGPVVRLWKVKASVAQGGKANTVNVIVFETISTNTVPVFIRVHDWNTRDSGVYREPVPQVRVTERFVPVAVPVFVRVNLCSMVSFWSILPPLRSISDAVLSSLGALMVTGTLGVPQIAHSKLFPT